MTWSYNPALSTSKDLVRFLMGDVDTSDQLVPDETITALLALDGNVYRVGAMVCESLAALAARQVTYQINQQVQEDLSDRIAQFEKLSRVLRQRAAMAGMVPYAGGLSHAEQMTLAENPDLVLEPFSHDMEEHRGTEAQPGELEFLELGG